MNNDRIEYPQIISDIMAALDFLPEEMRAATLGMFQTFLMVGLF